MSVEGHSDGSDDAEKGLKDGGREHPDRPDDHLPPEDVDVVPVLWEHDDGSEEELLLFLEDGQAVEDVKTDDPVGILTDHTVECEDMAEVSDDD